MLCEAIFLRLSKPNIFYRPQEHKKQHGKTTEEGKERDKPKLITTISLCEPPHLTLHPYIAVMLEKSIRGCQTGQNAISLQSVQEITLAGR